MTETVPLILDAMEDGHISPKITVDPSGVLTELFMNTAKGLTVVFCLSGVASEVAGPRAQG